MSTSKYGYQLKRAVINVSSSGDNTLVAAPGSGLSIVVVYMSLISSDVSAITFESSTTTALTGAIELSDQSHLLWPFLEQGWISTTAGELLNLSSTRTNQLSGVLGYFIA
jgi:hypothetical protein